MKRETIPLCGLLSERLTSSPNDGELSYHTTRLWGILFCTPFRLVRDLFRFGVTAPFFFGDF
jgi:hypothetical protein